jgi:hypothetical protein
MSERPTVSPSEKRAARDAARKGDRIRRKAIRAAMRAGWAGMDADESNWLDEAAGAHPGPDAAVRVLYGLATKWVTQLADATGEDRNEVLSRALR